MEEILIPLEILEPEVTEEMLRGELFKDCLGKQTTSYGGSTRARVNNINLAVDKINGTVLLPGETFSYNEVVGQRTIANGFQEAGAYSNGEVVQEVGGGICQVSSTLYCASLYSRMTIVTTSDDELELDQIGRQLAKLVDVRDIKVLKSGQSVNRELILVKVKTSKEQRRDLIELANIFRAKIVDVGTNSTIVELTGTENKLNAFLRLLDDYEILELARTGITGLSRDSFLL